jgi:hypothetical protein
MNKETVFILLAPVLIAATLLALPTAHSSEAKKAYCGDVISGTTEAPRLCYDTLEECNFARENLATQGTFLTECYKGKPYIQKHI